MSSELFVSRSGSQIWAALREDGVLTMLRVEGVDEQPEAGRIVKGRVTKVVPGIQSAFVDVGLDRDAYLHASELVLPGEPSAAGGVDSLPEEGGDSGPAPRARPAPSMPIEDRLREGRELLVQVEREGLGSKGPRVTTRITLPGRYLVLVPQGGLRGISRRIRDPHERERLQAVLDGLPPAGGYIVRSAGEGVAAERFERDAERLIRCWETIGERYATARAPAVLHAEIELALRLLRDAPGDAPRRVIVDDPALYERAASFLRDLDPALAARLRLHPGPRGLFESHGLDLEIQRALRSKVWLRSGGYLVIQQTEALVSIDVNTGRFVGGKLVRETVLATNLEAAREVARQLRLRDLGGIVVVDFVDMADDADRQRVLAVLQEELRNDRVRTQIAGMSELGLVQLTRKRSRRGVEAAVTRPCPLCSGEGRIKSPETVAGEAVAELRRVLAGLDGRVVTVRAHPDVARELRAVLHGGATGIEEGSWERVRVVADAAVRPDHFDLLAL